VGLIHRLPHAHLNLGIALARSGNSERAITAFKTALNFSPGFVDAHRWIATVSRTMTKDAELALKHSELARKYAARQSTGRKFRDDRRGKLFDIPEFPSEKERNKILAEKRPHRTDPRRKSGKEFVLVSGLPRSGTSLMMQMLELGGLKPKTDSERIADEDNPRGYYEWEAIKKILSKPQLMDEEGLDEKAIKVISMLLPQLPYAHNYKVIFMTRPIEQVLASQISMIDRLGTEGSDEEEVAAQLVNHRNAALQWLERNDRAEYLEIDYPTLVESPEEIIPLIVEFLGSERLPNHDQMINAIDRKLYRQKSES
jgi:tetratricopeptide (TPR) repeat protein